MKSTILIRGQGFIQRGGGGGGAGIPGGACPHTPQGA